MPVLDSRCHVELLGHLRVVQADQEVTRFSRQKAASLLAYLALYGPRPHPREHLIDLFWPDLDLPAGRDNLSTTLASLRRQIEPPGLRRGSVLVTSHTQVGLSPDTVTTDVADFERCLQQGAHAQEPQQRAALLLQALALYRGDLLPGVYENWAVREADRLRLRALEARRRLAQALEQSGDLEGALEAARRVVEADPSVEEAQTHLVRLYVQAGRPAAARAAYDSFVRALREEFGAGPTQAFRDEAARLLADGPSAHPRRESVPAPGIAAPAPIPRPVSGPLPLPIDRFFGREGELDTLAKMLLPKDNVPGARLATLTGAGGQGKTRLALEFVRRAAGRTGAWGGLIPLADVTEPSDVAGQIAHALGLPPDATAAPLDQIQNFFRAQERSQPIFLVLDNLEHLLPGGTDDAGSAEGTRLTELILTLLQRIPNLQCLCTSRRRLNVRGEQMLPLGPLPVPTEAAAQTLTALSAIPSVSLYVDRARAARPDFGLTDANAAAVAALCRHLEGSPLALELAAAWVRTVPPRRMWERVAQEGTAVLEARYADVPPRHRSLRAALDWSWRLLSPAQQSLCARLSVFRGGWTREAAAWVGETPEALEPLADLEDASLVRVEESGRGEMRYRFLETVRQYAADRLRECGDEAGARARHRDFFLALAEQAGGMLTGPDQAEWLDRLQADHDNFKVVLEGCRESPALAGEGIRLAVALGRYWYVRGHWGDLRQALEALLSCGGTDSRAQAIGFFELGEVGGWQGQAQVSRDAYLRSLALCEGLGDLPGMAGCLRSLGKLAQAAGDYGTGRSYFERCLQLRVQMNRSADIADALHNLGGILWAQGDAEGACRLYEESLALSRRSGDEDGVASVLTELGLAAWKQGRCDEARVRLGERLAILRRLGNAGGVANTLLNLSRVAQAQGDSAGALSLIEESLSLYRSLGHQDALAGALQHLGSVAEGCGDQKRAEAAYRERQEIQQRLGNA